MGTLDCFMDILKEEEHGGDWSAADYEFVAALSTGELRRRLYKRAMELDEIEAEIAQGADDPFSPEVIHDNGVTYTREEGPA